MAVQHHDLQGERKRRVADRPLLLARQVLFQHHTFAAVAKRQQRGPRVKGPRAAVAARACCREVVESRAQHRTLRRPSQAIDQQIVGRRRDLLRLSKLPPNRGAKLPRLCIITNLCNRRTKLPRLCNRRTKLPRCASSVPMVQYTTAVGDGASPMTNQRSVPPTPAP
eukprot:3180913-Prymnesium_polylepis.1